MLKYIIRLDDACPNMNKKNWDKIENLLDRYAIKPIVGVIPDNCDKEFCYDTIKDFWNAYPKRWQDKGWIIAQHGLNHDLSDVVRTEFKGLPFDKQKEKLLEGNEILKKYGVYPSCFFAPAHTFDKNTILACKEIEEIKFVSDGYAFYPYLQHGMLFIPCCFDTPHKISPFGIFTFVYHPNKITDEDLEYLEKFIVNNREFFDIDIAKTIEQFSNRKKKIFDYGLGWSISFFRKIRNGIKGE